MQKLQYEKKTGLGRSMLVWQQLKVSPDKTHHLLESKPAYPARFSHVLKFHPPGLAPVRDSTGAFHILTNGKPLYDMRYRKTFGFYEGLATVCDDAGWLHIDAKGNPLYQQRYGWCGNFQENKCVVLQKNGLCFHIDSQGNALYPEKYSYAGDFKDGIAVVCRYDGLSTHIDPQGRFIHPYAYSQLDVFHKGFARAKDEQGWFHVDFDGRPAYQSRFASVEPFYNGQAHAETLNGSLVVIREEGDVIREIHHQSRNSLGSLSSDLVGFWKSEAIRLGIELQILKYLPSTSEQLQQHIGIPAKNVERLLRALWECTIVTKQNDCWILTEKGNLLTPSEDAFMDSATYMWDKVQREWKNLTTKLTSHQDNYHLTFKELTNDENAIEMYRKVLQGYANEDFHKIARWDLWRKYKKVIAAGQTGITFIKQIVKNHDDVRAVMINRNCPLYQVDCGPSIEQRFLDPCQPWGCKGDAILLPRFLHYFPNSEAIQILHNCYHALAPNGQLYIFEMVLQSVRPDGGLLDLNMLAESGGKLRTLEEWKEILNETGFRIHQYEKIYPHLHMVIGEK